MKHENQEWQVSNLELSKKIKELGVKQESLWWWCRLTQEFRLLEFSKVKNLNREKSSAFTVAELGEILPKGIYDKKEGFGELSITPVNSIWVISYPKIKNRNEVLFWEQEKTLANAMAKMVIYLLKNKLMEIPK